MDHITYEANRVVFPQNSERHLSLVLRGLLKAVSTTEDGQVVTVSIYGPGDIVGLPSETCEIIALKASVIKPTELTPAAIRLLTERRLQAMERRFIDALTRTVGERLADTLLKISDQLKSPIVSVSQVDLASFVGTTIYTVNRLLHYWEGKGAIELVHGINHGRTDGRRFPCIVDRDKLRSFGKVVIRNHSQVGPMYSAEMDGLHAN